MRAKFAMCLAMAFLVTPVVTQAQKSKAEKYKPDFTQRYLVLPILLTSTFDLENHLNEAAAAGYCLLFGSPTNSDDSPVMMEKVAQPPNTYQYLLIGLRGSVADQLAVPLRVFGRLPVARKNLEMKLNEAAAQGFRLLPHTVIVKQQELEKQKGQKGPPPVAYLIEAVMEKPPGPVLQYQYRILSNVSRSTIFVSRPSEFEKQMRQNAAEGFLPVGMLSDGQTIAGILEKPVPAQDEPIATPPQESKPDEKPPYLWLAAETTSAVQKDLREAATAGYRLRGFSTLEMPPRQGDELAAILERVTQPLDTHEYLLLATTRISTLQKELNEAGGRGFRLLPRTLISRKPPQKTMVSFYGGLARGLVINEFVALMEKTPGSPNRYQYEILQTMRFPTLQKELTEANEQGYAVVAGTVGFQYTAILEKPIDGKADNHSEPRP